MARFSYDVERSPGYWVTTASHALDKAFNEELAPHGITFRQAQVVGWLVVEPDISQVELARRMHIEAPTLHGILDRMERDGWVERCPCEEDRRRNLLRPCEGIRPEWERIVACAERVQARATRGLAQRDLDAVKRTLTTLRLNLEDNR